MYLHVRRKLTTYVLRRVVLRLDSSRRLRPRRQDSTDALLREAGVVLSPGNGGADASDTPAAIRRIQPAPEDPEQVEVEVTFSLRNIVRLAVGALIFPSLARRTGDGLLWIARSQERFLQPPSGGAGWLRIALGLRDPELWKLATSLPPTVASLWTPPKFLMLTEAAAAAEDPVWIRMSLGGLLLSVVKDVGSVVRTALLVRQLASRRIQQYLP